jgi:peptide/nickel transport system ATP-binding protein
VPIAVSRSASSAPPAPIQPGHSTALGGVPGTVPQAHGSEPLLSVQNLHVQFETSRGTVRAVEGVTYDVKPGEMIAIVGESGSGKSVSALAMMQLLPKLTARIPQGKVMFEGRNLVELSEAEMEKIRGRHIAMIFQEPMTSLNPVLQIGIQIMEPLLIHLKMTPDAAKSRAMELLELVGMTDPARRLEQYPHQLSGGMRQRVMIAIGLACNPKLLIADEPTTALDVTIQAQILELMKDLSRRLNIATIMITHNLGVVARYADRVNVMYAARIVESGPADVVFARPLHPYTRGLLRSVPRLDQPRASSLETIEGLPPNLMAPPEGCRFAPRCRLATDKCRKDVPPLEVRSGAHNSACWHIETLLTEPVLPPVLSRTADLGREAHIDKPILEIKNLHKYFTVKTGGFFSGKTGTVKALQDVSLTMRAGETLGLVGESGCGKSTLGRVILKLEEPTQGQVLFEGQDINGLDKSGIQNLRQSMQVVFQDPYSSLNPRMTVGQIIGEPLAVHKIEPDKEKAKARIAELLELVGLYPYMAARYPHELSGGQRQRVGIARALAMKPRFLVCDEAVSALDVSIQGQVINLLESLQEKLGLTYLFIAHDLAVVRHISARVAVMYLGHVVELAHCDDIYKGARHPYTKALLQAAPIPDPQIEKTRPRTILKGEIPSPLNPPTGCVFHTRCPIARESCKTTVPALQEVGKAHWAACPYSE